MIGRLLIVALLACSGRDPVSPTPPPASRAPALVLAHRGFPARLPDHTLEGYRLAVEAGADAIEPDLVPTRDGVLIARHENLLTHTTDVAQRLPGREQARIVDGEALSGWFSEDLTLDEIRQLRAIQPFPGRPHEHDGRYAIPTFDEVLALRAELSASTGRPIAVYPETKHPTHFREAGLALEPLLIDALRRHGLTGPDDPVFVQSFEPDSLDRIGRELQVRRVLLVGDLDARPVGEGRTYRELLADLPALRARVEGVGVDRSVVHGSDPSAVRSRGPAGPTGFVERAHAAGLFVHVWTFRPEPERVGLPFMGDPRAELARFLELGVDGVFADDPAMAVDVRDAMR